MTEPLLVFPGRRIEVYPARKVQYIGSANLRAYKQDLADLVSRISTTRWEDIDPDRDPSVPMRPTWRNTEFSTETQEIVDLIDRYLGTDEEIVTPEDTRRRAAVVEVRTFTLDDNYERCMKLEARVKPTSYDCWELEDGRVDLRDISGRSLTVNAHLAIWLLEYGEDITNQTWLKHVGESSWYTQRCVRPDHHTRHN